MDELCDECEIHEDSSSAYCSSKANWFFEKGLWLGKRVAITGFVISSAPLVLPPLVVASALGIAVSIPSGVVIASYACTEKLMSKLLPRPITYLTSKGGTLFDEKTGEVEYIEDGNSWSGTRKELLEGRDDEVLYEYVETSNQGPFEEAPLSAGGIGCEEYFGENLNASWDDYSSGHTHTKYNYEEPMNVVGAEAGNEEDVGEDLNLLKDDYGSRHTYRENNDEEPINDVGAKVKEEGYKEDVDEDLNASRDDDGSGLTLVEYADDVPMNDMGAKIREEGYEEDGALRDDYDIGHTHTVHNDKEPMHGVGSKVVEEGYEEDVDEDLSASRNDNGSWHMQPEYNNEEPINDVEVKEEGYEEDVGEDLNASRDDNGIGHTHTEHNDKEPMDVVDAKVKEEGYEEDVDEDLDASRDDYGTPDTHSEHNDEEPMNDVGAKVKEEGYGEDVDEDLDAFRDVYGTPDTHSEHNDEEPMDDVDVKVAEEGYKEDVDENLNALRSDYGIRLAHTEHNDEEPMDDADAKVKQEGYVEYNSKDLNPSREFYGKPNAHTGYNAGERMDGVDTEVKEDAGEDLKKSTNYYGSGHAHTEFNDRMNGEDTKVREEGYEEDDGEEVIVDVVERNEEDVGKELNALEDDHGSRHIHAVNNGEEPLNDVRGKVQEEGYEKDVDEDLNASRDGYGIGHTHTENNDEEPMNGGGAKVEEEGYRGDIDENLNASRDDYGSGHTHTGHNDLEPMNDVGAKTMEGGYKEGVDEDLNASRDDYGTPDTRTEHNDEESMGDVDTKIKQEGYVEFVSEDLNASRDDYFKPNTHIEYNCGERMNGVDTEVKEAGYEEDVGEDLKKPTEFYGSGHAHTELNDNDRMNDEDAMVKEEGYGEDGGKYLQGEDEGALEGIDVETKGVGKEENDGMVPVVEQSIFSHPGGHVDEDISRRNGGVDSTNMEECILVGERMALIGNLRQEGDVSTPVKEAGGEEKDKFRTVEGRDEKNFTSIEENGKINDEEEPMTAANKDIEMNDIDAKVKEEDYKEKVDEYDGENERPLEIEVDGEEGKKETEVVIERSEWDQQVDDAQQVDMMVDINDKNATKNVGDEKSAGETTILIEELRKEDNVSSPVEKAWDEEKNEISEERDGQKCTNLEEKGEPYRDLHVEPGKPITVDGKAESELIHEEIKEIEATQATLVNHSDDELAKEERVLPLGTVLQVNKDENNGLVESEKPTTERNRSYSGEGSQQVEESKSSVENKKSVKRKRRNKNGTSGAAHKGFQSKGKKEVVFSDADAREIVDESGLLLFGHREKAGEDYPCSAFENPAVYEKSSHDASGCENPLEISLPEVVTKSSKMETDLEANGAVSSSKVLVDDEAKIWENIEALRTIVGYKVAPQENCVDELKLLYIFTGVEPPTSFKSPSDLAEVNDKLHFLMAIVGVK